MTQVNHSTSGQETASDHRGIQEQSTQAANVKGTGDEWMYEEKYTFKDRLIDTLKGLGLFLLQYVVLGIFRVLIFALFHGSSDKDSGSTTFASNRNRSSRHF